MPFFKLSWGTIHETAFNELQSTLNGAMKLAYLYVRHVAEMYSNKSDKSWAAIIMQCLEDNERKPIDKKDPEQLAFFGGKFMNTKKDWTTYEKEAFALIKNLIQ